MASSESVARKILFYTHAFGGGGAEVVFGRLAGAFAAAGDEVIFAADFPGPTPVEDRPNLRHVLLGASHGEATWALRDLLRRERPDASFSALGAQNLKHVAAALLSGRLGHCVLGFHGFAVAEAGRLSRACFWLAPVITRMAAATVCVSDVLLVDLCARWGASSQRTLRIYNPIGGGIAPPRVPDDPPLVVACGRLVPGKDFPALLSAFVLTQPGDARLAILGEGPERNTIETTVARLSLADRVDLPGHVADPSDWYRRASCLAIASESESFGLTAIEALAHGVPVVSTDCGGPAEILDDEGYGLLVPVGDELAMAEALTAVLADPGPDEPRRQRAEAFTLDRIHAAYAELVDALSPGEDQARAG